jgi:hypothetical protein
MMTHPATTPASVSDHVPGRSLPAASPPRDEGESVIRETLKRLSAKPVKNRASLAALLSVIGEKRLFFSWGFRSFRQYIENRCGFMSYSNAQRHVRVFRRCRASGVPFEQLDRLSLAKADFVFRILPSENREKFIEDCEGLKYREIGAMVRRRREHSNATAVTVSGPPANSMKVHPWLLPKPPENEFYVAEDVWEQLCFALEIGENVLLIGPSGCGKTELIYRLTATAGRHIEPFNCGAMTEARGTLIGNTHFDPLKGTWFAPSRFVRAVQRPGCCILLDELSRCSIATVSTS